MGLFVPTTNDTSLVNVKNKGADHQWSLLLVATATTILTIGGSWIVQTLRKRLIERSIIIILPSPSTTTTTATTSSTTGDKKCRAPRNESEGNHQQTDNNNVVLQPPPLVHHILLMIFPGALIDPREYVSIAKQVQRRVEVIQQENSPSAEPRIQVTVGIGPLMYFITPPWTRWAFQNDTTVVAQWIRTKATEAAVLVSSDSSTTTPAVFQDVYVWGHSLGGNAAIEAAYPSHCSGLLLYGGSWNHILKGQQPQDLIGYPRPTLTMMGERDGFLRYTHVASELSHRLHDLKRKVKLLVTTNTTTVAITTQLERTIRWTKPIVTVPEANHLHMSSGIPPRLTTMSGRTDLTSRYEDDQKSSGLQKAQAALAEVAVDFMLANSKPPTLPLLPLLPPTNALKALAQERLLKHCYRTEQSLQPFMDMTTLPHKVQFAQQALQSLVLQRVFGPSSPFSRTSLPMVVVEWRERAKDFMYSKPHHDLLHHDPEDATNRSGASGMDGSNYQYHLYIEVTEQDPIDIGKLVNPKSRVHVAQVSKTLAVKAKSVEAIKLLFTAINQAGGVKHSTNVERTTHAITTTTTTHMTLQQLNEQTFHHVLNKVVTHEQRQRYLEEGNALTFGPDMDVQSAAPFWLEMPLQLTKQKSRTTTPNTTTNNKSSKNGYIYVLSSPFITTSTTLPSPFDGMYYFKPLSPAQAYEWIVFDAFKNGQSESHRVSHLL
jgi:hypothetical protein